MFAMSQRLMSALGLQSSAEKASPNLSLMVPPPVIKTTTKFICFQKDLVELKDAILHTYPWVHNKTQQFEKPYTKVSTKYPFPSLLGP